MLLRTLCFAGLIAVITVGCASAVRPECATGENCADAAAPRDSADLVEIPTRIDASSPDIPLVLDAHDAPDAPRDAVTDVGVDALETGLARDVPPPDDAVSAPDGSPSDDAASAPDGVVSMACPVALMPALQLPDDVRVPALRGTNVMYAMAGSPASDCLQRLPAGPGAADTFPLHIAARTGVTASVVPDGVFDARVSIRRVCDDPTTEEACANTPNDTAAVLNQVLEPGAYFLVVRLPTGVGYALRTTVFDPPANDSCETATALTPGVRLQRLHPSARETASVCGLPMSRETFYTLSIPPASAARIDAPWPVTLRAVDHCDDSTCIATGSVGFLSLGNPGAAPRDVTIAVERADTTPFDLLATVHPFADNSRCTAARRLNGSTVLTGESLDAVNPLSGPAACNEAAAGRQLYYTITVPPGNSLIARVFGSGPSPAMPDLTVRAGCGAGACPEVVNVFGDPPGLGKMYRNTSSAPVDVVLAVGTRSQPGTFDLSVQLVPAPTSVACTSAPTVADGTVVQDQVADLGVMGDPYVCDSSYGSRTLYYQTVVPPNYRLLVRTSPEDSRAILRIGRTCSDVVCPASPISTTGLLSRDGEFTNRGTTALPVVIAFAHQTLYTDALPPLDLSFSIQPAPAATQPSANRSCDQAITVTDGSHLTGQNAGETNAWIETHVCTADSRTRRTSTLYYRATIPPGFALRARATPRVGPTGVVVAIVADCARRIMDPLDAVADEANLDTSPHDVIIAVIVDRRAEIHPDAPRESQFDLDVALRPVGFAAMDIPPACDDMSDAINVLDPLRIEDLAPGFAFALLGQPVTHVGPDGISTDGGATWDWVSAYAPIRWPYSNPPTVRVVGSAPQRHITLQWTKKQDCDHALASNSIWQVQLDEGSNALEFHYCRHFRIESNGAVDSEPGYTSAAWFGVQSADGTQGFRASLPSLPADRALRLVSSP